MKKNINLIIIPLLLLSFFAFSGFDCESQNGIELRIISIGDGFTGYYVIDGGIEEPLMPLQPFGDNGFSFIENLGTFRFIEIRATKTNSRSMLNIYLYDQNGNLLQKVTNHSCSTGNWQGSTATCSDSSTMSYTFRTTGR